MADFYALGELLIDFTPAGKTPAGIPIFEQNPGGAPANVAVQAARLGVSAGFIGKVGQDMFGTFLRDTLVKQNVDVENLHFSNDTATSLAFVQLSESGDRDFSFTVTPAPIRKSRSMRSIRMRSQTPRCCASARSCSPQNPVARLCRRLFPTPASTVLSPPTIRTGAHRCGQMPKSASTP